MLSLFSLKYNLQVSSVCLAKLKCRNPIYFAEYRRQLVSSHQDAVKKDVLDRNNSIRKVSSLKKKDFSTPHPPKDPPETYEAKVFTHEAFDPPPRLPLTVFRKFRSPKEVLGPHADKCKDYKNPEYFSYHRYSFLNLQRASLKLRKERIEEQKEAETDAEYDAQLEEEWEQICEKSDNLCKDKQEVDCKNAETQTIEKQMTEKQAEPCEVRNEKELQGGKYKTPEKNAEDEMNKKKEEEKKRKLEECKKQQEEECRKERQRKRDEEAYREVEETKIEEEKKERRAERKQIEADCRTLAEEKLKTIGAVNDKKDLTAKPTKESQAKQKEDQIKREAEIKKMVEKCKREVIQKKRIERKCQMVAEQKLRDEKRKKEMDKIRYEEECRIEAAKKKLAEECKKQEQAEKQQDVCNLQALKQECIAASESKLQDKECKDIDGKTAEQSANVQKICNEENAGECITEKDEHLKDTDECRVDCANNQNEGLTMENESEQESVCPLIGAVCEEVNKDKADADNKRKDDSCKDDKDV